MKRTVKTKVSDHSAKSWLKAILKAVLLIILVKGCAFDFYVVPSASMEGNILSGDFIVGSKIHYGARLPFTPLSIPFTHQYLTKEKKSYSEAIKLGYFRFPGIRNVKRFDPLIFNYPPDFGHPIDKKMYYVKRCIGMPSDTLEIRQKDIFINGRQLDEISGVQYNYLIEQDASFDPLFFEKLGLKAIKMIDPHSFYKVACTPEQAKLIAKHEHILSVKRVMAPPYSKDHFLFPESSVYAWNLDHYGPVIIPKSGKEIQLTPFNLPLYKKAIEEYEGHKLEWLNEKIYLDDKEITQYRFKYDYYFVMGDNRDNSSDSRFWGFVPETHLVGKALLTLYSIDQSASNPFVGFRWNRFLKLVH